MTILSWTLEWQNFFSGEWMIETECRNLRWEINIEVKDERWSGDQGRKVRVGIDKCALLSWGCVRLSISKVNMSGISWKVSSVLESDLIMFCEYEKLSSWKVNCVFSVNTYSILWRYICVEEIVDWRKMDFGRISCWLIFWWIFRLWSSV